jgi:hypothetical protein
MGAAVQLLFFVLKPAMGFLVPTREHRPIYLSNGPWSSSEEIRQCLAGVCAEAEALPPPTATPIPARQKKISRTYANWKSYSPAATSCSGESASWSIGHNRETTNTTINLRFFVDLFEVFKDQTAWYWEAVENERVVVPLGEAQAEGSCTWRKVDDQDQTGWMADFLVWEMA